MKSSSSRSITMVMLSYVIAASCFVEKCKKASMGPYSIVRSDISLKSCSSAGQVNAIPSSINAYGRKDAGYSLSAALAAVVLSLPEVTKATASPLGVDKDGYFELCPEAPLAGCISSQDDRPAVFLAPWEYEGDFVNAKRKVLRYLSTVSGLLITSGGDAEIPLGENLEFLPREENQSRYIRAVVTDKTNSFEDDLEFYFTPNDSTIQYRGLRRKGYDLFGLDNRNRIEKMRLALRFLNIPILRNRRRVLFFVESPLDSFGPPTIMFDKLLDNVSGEMEFKNGVIGDIDPLSPVWETPSTAAIKIKKEKELKRK